MSSPTTAPQQQEPHSAWYLIQCKPRQDERAEENLLRQGYTCYRPRHIRERLQRGQRLLSEESLFPGYLFIRLSLLDNWGPLRSTRGVSRVVSFGNQPLPVSEELIDHLQQRCSATPAEQLLETGDRVRINHGAFAELEAIFLSMDGNERVVLLMNILHREQKVRVPLSSIRKSE
ncbi:transcription/translation regulatory transformer protein RfaH [Pseudomonas stutzeri]|nr:transcription/translation regulatory transformer protein RfaH [Stutzerimonas stutzeri]